MFSNALFSMNSLRALLAGVCAAAFVGCSADAGDVTSELLVGADETVAASADALSGRVAVGSTLRTTANLSLRTGPSTRYRSRLTMPNGARVTALQSSPNNGFYKIRYNGYDGWASGGYLALVSSGGGGGGGGSRVDTWINRAREGVGYSYWWGHGRWSTTNPNSANRGRCSGSCPSCRHSGSYGADCSGFLAKAWIVPGSNSNLTVDSHPYSTYSFTRTSGGGQWGGIARGSARRGDALGYNSGGAGHILLIEGGSGWGSILALEAKGCSYGITRGYRGVSSAYRAIRRR